MSDDRPDARWMRETAGPTKAAVAATSAAADAIGRFTKAAQPRVASRRLTLADHLPVARCLHWAIRMASSSLVCEANSVRFQYGESGTGSRGGDLQRTLITAAQHCRDGCNAWDGADDAMSRDIAAMPEGAAQAEVTRRSTPLGSAARNASATVQELDKALRMSGYSIRLSGHAEIADLLSRTISDLVTLCGYEALLIDGCYEDAGIGRRAGRVTGPIVKGGFDLRRANRSLAVACVVLRDDAAAGIGRRRSA